MKHRNSILDSFLRKNTDEGQAVTIKVQSKYDNLVLKQSEAAKRYRAILVCFQEKMEDEKKLRTVILQVKCVLFSVNYVHQFSVQRLLYFSLFLITLMEILLIKSGCQNEHKTTNLVFPFKICWSCICRNVYQLLVKDEKIKFYSH